MARWRQAVELAMTDEEIERLVAGSRSRTEAAGRVERAQILLAYREKFARSVLRHIRVASKQELKERIMAGIKDANRHPVIHTWSYKLAEAA